MLRRYPLLVLLSILVLVAGIYGSYRAFRPSGFPFTIHVVNPQTAVIEPIAGVPLPSTLQASDRIDLRALDTSSRIAIAIAGNSYGQLLPPGHTYQLVMYQSHGSVTMQVVTIDTSRGTGSWISSLSLAALIWLLSVIALVLLWRGRGRAAIGMTLWAIAWMAGIALEIAPFDGVEGLTFMVIAYFCVLVSRIGFYLMFEAMLEGVFRPRILLWWRVAFVLQWVVAFFWTLASNLTFPLGGSAMFLIPGWGSLLGVSYLVPLVMLYSGYHAVDVRARQRLRWMLWGGTLWVISAFSSDVITFASFSWNLVWTAAFVLAACCFVYAVLRHRVVNVSVFIDRTLVYGSVTALVVGVLAAVQSVVQHAALGTSASVLLQIVVPLALGIVLGQVRGYADKIVERVFFRHKYLAEKALRLFAQSCGGYENSGELLMATVRNIHQKINAVGVAIYERGDTQYRQTRYAGLAAYPQSAGIDDEAFAAVRSGQEDIDLSELHSAIGTNGIVFAMGRQAILVCANRPGEHYAADERKLLRSVAFQAGAAFDALRMQEAVTQLKAKASLVDAVLAGALPASAKIKARARELASVSVTT